MKGIVQALTAQKSKGKKAEEIIRKKRGDIIVKKYHEEQTVNDKGEKIIKRVPTLVNITKKVNETAKLVKEQTAAEKLAAMEKIFSQGA